MISFDVYEDIARIERYLSFPRSFTGLVISTIEGELMRWPFQSNRETDLRIYRDPATDEIMLRVVGPLGLPSPENPILTFTVTMGRDPEAARTALTFHWFDLKRGTADVVVHSRR